MSRTDPTALTDALLAQRPLTLRTDQDASPAAFSVEAPAAAALGTWLGHGFFLQRFPELKAVGVKVSERLLARPRDRHYQVSRR